MIPKPLYEWRKIDKIWWICNKNNLIDTITMTLSNLALEEIILINKTTIRL